MKGRYLMSNFELIAIDKKTLDQFKETSSTLGVSLNDYLFEMVVENLRADLEAFDDLTEVEIDSIDNRVSEVEVLYLGEPPYPLNVQ